MHNTEITPTQMHYILKGLLKRFELWVSEGVLNIFDRCFCVFSLLELKSES